MAGNKKAIETIKQRYGDDHFKKIGAMGGFTKTDKPRGFKARPDVASLAGKKGGSTPRVKK